MSERNESISPSEFSHQSLQEKSLISSHTALTGKTKETNESSNTIYSIVSNSLVTKEEFIEDLQSMNQVELGEKVHIYAPRKSGKDIAPGIKKLMSSFSFTSSASISTSNSAVNSALISLPRDLKYHQKYFKIFMERSRIKDIEKHLYHLQYFDQSDTIESHGVISKKIYDNILSLRNFDAYARPLYLSEESLKQYYENHRKYLLGKKYKYKRKPDESEKVRKEAIPVFEQNLPIRKKVITTEPWKVGMKEVLNPPVGFAKTPGNILKSEGREGYYSYDGEWKDGKMNGEGYYLFSDGKSYKGYFKNNNCEGNGSAEYPIGSSYNGEWKNGKFHGDGELSYAGGTAYKGGWKNGKRDGKGILTLPCGLSYEGDFRNGVPHGRGKMVSTLTGYSYEGSFEK